MSAEQRLADAFVASHPLEAAHLLEQADPVAGAALLARAAPRVIAANLQRMDAAAAGRLLAQLPARAVSGAVSELPLGVASLVLRTFDSQQRSRILGQLPETITRSLETALAHPAETAGALMDSNVLAAPAEITVQEARSRVRRRSKPAGNYLYVVDAQHKLVGAVGIGELMLASPATTLASLMRSTVVQIPARAGMKLILAHEGWRELHALPVVDADGTLVGILRRETYERLRAEHGESGGRNTGGLGLTLAELAWTVTASAVDEVAQAIRPKPDDETVEESGS